MKQLLFFIPAFLYLHVAFSQKSAEPLFTGYYDEVLKKEKGKTGLWTKSHKTWFIAPEYDEVVPVYFHDGTNSVQSKKYVKFIKGGHTDLVEKVAIKRDAYSSNAFDYNQYFYTVILSGIDDFIISHSNEASTLMFYKKNGKWGWLLQGYGKGKIKTIKTPHLQKINDVLVWSHLQEATFDELPVIINSKITYNDDETLLLAYSGDTTGLYTEGGKKIHFNMPAGQFISIKKLEYFYLLEDTNHLLGILANAHKIFVEPQYVSITENMIRYETYFNALVLECKRPNGTIDYRKGFELELESSDIYTKIENEIEALKAHQLELKNQADKKELAERIEREKREAVERPEREKREAAEKLQKEKEELAAQKLWLRARLDYFRNYIFFAGPYGMGIKKKGDGTVVMHPALRSVTIGNRRFYYSNKRIGCKELDSVIIAETDNELSCELKDPYGKIKVEFGYNEILELTSLEELKREGKVEEGYCSPCMGKGSIQHIEKVVTRQKQTITSSGKCYSCGDVITTRNGITTVSAKTYSTSYTIPEQSENKYTYETCLKCNGTGKTKLAGYFYNAETKVYDWYGIFPKKKSKFGDW